MADFLELASAGYLDQQASPTNLIDLQTAGYRDRQASPSKGLRLVSAGYIDRFDNLTATVDACTACDNDPGQTGGGCNCQCTGASGAGWMMWVRWNHTGCADASMHISIWRKVGAGSWTQWQDPLGCTSDNSTCTPSGCTKGVTEGTFEYDEAVSGGTTTAWDFRVYIHADSDHSVIGGPCDTVIVSHPPNTCSVAPC